MFERAAHSITQKLYNNQIVQKDDLDLYEYGFNMAFTILLNLISTVLVGVIMGRIFESIAFLAFYIPLRSYAGGYHAKTSWRCYFVSIFIIFSVLLLIKLLPFNIIIYGGLLLIGSPVCFILSPVQDENKPLDADERARYHKIAVVILSAEIFVWLILLLVPCFLGQIIPVVVFIEAVMLVAGKIKNRFSGLTDVDDGNK